MGDMLLYVAFIFSGTQKEGFYMKETNYDTCDAAFLGLFLLNSIFSKKIGTVLLADHF